MKKFFSVTMVAICLLLSQTSNAQIYILIDGVEGESQFRDFPNSTELQSVSWGGSNTTTLGREGSGAASGKVSISDFNIMKVRGAGSSAIQMAVYSGKRIAKAEIRFYTSGQQPTVYLTIILEDVLVTSWQISGSGPERPTESISLMASRVKTEETIRNPNGTSKRVTTGWDVARNTAISW